MIIAGLFVLITIAPLNAQAASSALPSALTPSTNDDFWIKAATPVTIDWQQKGSRKAVVDTVTLTIKRLQIVKTVFLTR